ncbi:MAG: ferrous iron transporter B, partial [Firmicutes bacterium]|nr:ferrous iron transporter B [Bacillota bacterium]
EIVIPIIIMTYMATGTLTDYSSLAELKFLFIDNGWTITTALCTMLFSIVHFPCATTCLTVYKETKSIKWTCAAFIIPTLAGILVCFTANIVLSIAL